MGYNVVMSPTLDHVLVTTMSLTQHIITIVFEGMSVTFSHPTKECRLIVKVMATTQH
jgi:hypothetical protein